MPPTALVQHRCTLQWSKGIAVRALWRWSMRGVALLALVAVVVLLGLHPTASYHPVTGTNYPPVATTSCPSPFDRIYPEPYQVALPGSATASVACSAATNGREHVAGGLAIGAVLLIGLSLLPRRKAMATKQFEPSPV